MASCSFLVLCPLLCLFGAVSAQNGNCSIPPVTVPIKNVLLSNGQLRRGIAMDMGSPPQPFALLPAWFANNTYIYDYSAGSCDDLTEDGCVTLRGGLYDSSSSTTFIRFDDPAAAGADPVDNETVTDSNWGRDSLVLNSNSTLDDYPFGIIDEDFSAGYTRQGLLGLSSNSSILNALEAAGQIASRSFSFFWGLDGATEPVRTDGGIVFGGYDAAKIDGDQNITAQFGGYDSCSSGMLITIMDVELNFPNGSSPSLSPDRPFVCCVLPELPFVVTLSQSPYFDNFESLTQTSNIGRSSGEDFFNMMYPPDEVYTGDLTFKLENDIDIRVPNHQLVKPEMQVTDQGSVFENTTISVLLINSLRDANEDDVLAVGKYFFTSAYLTVNLDTQSFSIFKANPTFDTDPVAINDDSSAADCEVTGTISAGPSSSPTPQQTIAGDGSNSPSSLSGSAIAGAVVGSVFGAALIAVAVLYFLQRRRWRKQAAGGPKDDAVSLSTTSVEPGFNPGLQELGGSDPPEVYGSDPPKHELPVPYRDRVRVAELE
ncbi:aspartic peptidase domain-containing protein [Lineolata rhizophorae]|uniref:Aspartic peptidase domain-containing protein n=1 Tax=Lineolata rhizophorae TaxID=578093 RepID=A0A6A6P328_9PEZI|nr:aspartic peptidase domain-containing protein [Lineolata rhizophorae]